MELKFSNNCWWSYSWHQEVKFEVVLPAVAEILDPFHNFEQDYFEENNNDQ